METPNSAEFESATSAPKPAVDVEKEGFTVLWEGPNPIVDILFVHGLQGHPKKTWTSETRHQSIFKPASTFSKLIHKPSKQNAPSKSVGWSSCFWPEDLLAKDFANTRIATYGYDSKVSNFFGGAADQTTIVGHGRSLLHATEALRRQTPERPIIFVVHSLGGLILKETLRRSWQAQPYEADLRITYDCTTAIVFMGTPHRGSQYAPWGVLARNIAVALGFDASDRILRDLRVDSGILDLLVEDFSKMLKEDKFNVYTFMESKGLKGIRGLDGKVVEDVSSYLGDARERRDTINANHMEMCRFSGPRDNGYRKVRDAVAKCIEALKPCQSQQQPPFQSVSCQALLRRLYIDETRFRFEQVEPAFGDSFSWLFETPELGFEQWLRSRTGLYWIKGKPASGKSTLMKMACGDTRTTAILKTGKHRKAHAAFFFHGRGSQLQKSFAGLLQSILHQILSAVPELITCWRQTSASSLRDDAQSQNSPELGELFPEDVLKDFFDRILHQQILKIDICLFLDALDEYSGDHNSMAKFLCSVVSRGLHPSGLTNIQICFSSRPLQIFLDHFDQVPGFYMQNHTDKDIDIVIDTMMRDNPRMLRHLESSEEQSRETANALATEISSRAEGVFLWVRLILAQQLEQYTAGATMQQLQELLVLLPTDLEGYYFRILSSIPTRYHEDTMIMFDIIQCALRPFDLYTFIDVFTNARLQRLQDFTVTTSRAGESGDVGLERLIRSRCGGLVELRTTGTMFQVQFIHQTVKSFVQKESTRETLLNPKADDVHGYCYIFKHLLALITLNLLPDRTEETDFWDLGQYLPGNDHCDEELIHYAKLAETTTSRSQAAVLNQVSDHAIARLYNNSMWILEMGREPIESVFAFAVASGLELYLAEELDKNKPSPLLSRSILHLAVSPPLFNENNDRAAILKLLLDGGADLKTIYNGATAFQMLWSFKHICRATIVEVFLAHHQDPNVKTKYRERITKRQWVDRWHRPLHVAARTAEYPILQTLLRYSPEVNAYDSQGQTPLDRASSHLGNRIDAFISTYRSADPRERDLAARLSCISLLLDNGAKKANDPDMSEAIYDNYHFDPDIPVTKAQLTALQKMGIHADKRILALPQLRPNLSSIIADTLTKFLPPIQVSTTWVKGATSHW